MARLRTSLGISREWIVTLRWKGNMLELKWLGLRKTRTTLCHLAQHLVLRKSRSQLRRTQSGNLLTIKRERIANKKIHRNNKMKAKMVLIQKRKNENLRALILRVLKKLRRKRNWRSLTKRSTLKSHRLYHKKHLEIRLKMKLTTFNPNLRQIQSQNQ